MSWNTPKESSVVKSIRNYLSKLECPSFNWKVHGSQFSAGLPDIMMLATNADGKFVAIGFEVKRKGTAREIPVNCSKVEMWKKLGATDLQADTLFKIEQAGGYGYVVEELDQVKEILKKHNIH